MATRMVIVLFLHSLSVLHMATRMVVVLFLHSLSVLHGDSYGYCFVFTKFECSTWRLVWLLLCFYTV